MYILKDYTFIEVGDTCFVFNPNKTAWIAISKDAIRFCELYIQDKLTIQFDSLSEEEKVLFKGLNMLDSVNEEFNEEDEIKSCYVHVTQKCNLTCPYCYSLSNLRNNYIDKTYDEWKSAIEKLVEMGFKRVVFSGGEPLLHKDIFKILSFCKESGFIEIDLITNGTINLKTEELIQIKNTVSNLCVSLDGYDEETNSKTRGKGNFLKVVENIKKIRKMEIPVNIISTIYKDNIDYINKYLDLASSLDCTVSFSLFTLSGGAEENVELKQDDNQMKNLGLYLNDEDTPEIAFDHIPAIKGIQYREGCGAGNYLISVNADGEVYPCHFMMKPHLSMGNIFSDKNEVIISNGNEHANNMNIKNIEDCKSCEYKYFCGGGCRANSYNGKGEIRKSNDCKFYKSYYDNIIGEFDG